MNAVVASGVSASDYAGGFDTAWLDFTKGLGAPVGAVLAGSRELIDEAWRWKQMLGGALRQSGVLAAACLYALDNHVERLAEDHEHARRACRGLAALPGVALDPSTVETNIVIFGVDDAPALVARVAERVELQAVDAAPHQGGDTSRRGTRGYSAGARRRCRGTRLARDQVVHNKDRQHPSQCGGEHACREPPGGAHSATMTANTPEHRRLEQARTGEIPWKSWGPYLSERQWGTVREDYSDGGDAWNYFTHDQARSRAYRWGEDGIAGISDERQRLCLALALWNGADPILKERMFGLTNGEGNHGEDVKEYWFYLDSTPTHSYMQLPLQVSAARLSVRGPDRHQSKPRQGGPGVRAARHRHVRRRPLLRRGVEYAKADHDDILMVVTAVNRGPEAATLHVLPTLWFRNTWSWGDEVTKPALEAVDGAAGRVSARATHPELGEWTLRADASAQLLFCENETNNARLFGDPQRIPVRQGRGQRLCRRTGSRTPSIRRGPAPRSRRSTCSSSSPARAPAIRLRLTRGCCSGQRTAWSGVHSGDGGPAHRGRQVL